MGLDIYTGSLTRYYAKLWKTQTEQFAERTGVPYAMYSPEGASEAPPPDVEQVRQTVEAWMAHFSKSMPRKSPLRWKEDAESAWITEKIDWSILDALKLEAALVECPKFERPTVQPADCAAHPAMAAVRRKFLPCRFQHLYEPVTVWVPTSFNGTLTCLLPSDKDAVLGSSPTLLKNLEVLNERLFRANEQEIASWTEAGALDALDSFSRSSRWGFAVLWRHARFSIEHDVPIVLDY